MKDTVGIRSKCSLVQKINRCPSELSVKLVIGDPKNALYTLTAFQNKIWKQTEDNIIDKAERITTVKTPHLPNAGCVIDYWSSPWWQI